MCLYDTLLFYYRDAAKSFTIVNSCRSYPQMPCLASILTPLIQGLCLKFSFRHSPFIFCGGPCRCRTAEVGFVLERACGESPGFRALAAGILRRAMRTGFATAPFCGEAEGMRSGMEDDLRIFRRTVCAGLLQPFRNAGQ